MMTNLQSSAFVAKTTQLLSSVARLRLLLVMFLTLTVTTNAWGATITIDGSASGITTTDGNQTITVDGITFKGKFKQYSTTALWFTSGSGYIYNTTSLGTINSITINYKSGGSGSSKQYFTSGNSAITSYQSGTPQITTSTGGASGTHSSFSGGFFNISISNKNLQATSIVIDYTPAGGGETPDPTTYTINWHTAVGTVVDEVLEEGATITKPATDPTMSGYVFMGWTEACEVASNGSDFTAITNFGTATEDKDYYAVFAEATTTGGGGGSTDVTIDLTDGTQVTTNSTENLVFTEGDVTFTNTKVSGSTAANNYSPVSSTVRTSTRTYNGHKVTIAAGSTISKIVITAASTNYATAIQNATWTNGSATASSSTVTVTPSSGVSTVSFTPSATAGMTKVVVTTGGGGSTTYDNYRTTCTTETVPSLSVSGVSESSLAFGNVTVNSPQPLTFTLSGSNLTADATLALSGTNAGLFSVSPTSVTPSNGSITSRIITVTYTPDAKASHSAILTISSTDAESIEISLSGTGVAQTANYTVKHYQQNITDDNYTLKETQTLSGEVGTYVTPAVKSYEGFTAPSTTEVTIAADGKTVVEYYYTRNSYTLTWDVNEGNALTGTYTSGSVKFGATITKPDDPTRAGYNFSGWHDGTSIVTPASTMPANDLTYTAQWKATYTVTFLNHGEEVEKVTVEAGNSVTLPTEELTSCDTEKYPDFFGWTETPITGVGTEKPADLITADFTPEGSMTLHAVFVDQLPQAGGWQVVTSTSELVAGKIYTIGSFGSPTTGTAMGTQNSNNRGTASWTTGTPVELTLGGSTGAWTLYDAAYDNGAGGYLYAASSSSNHLKTQTTLSANGKWAITISSNKAKIVAQGNNTRNIIRYNESGLFSCYASGQEDIQLLTKAIGKQPSAYITSCCETEAPTDGFIDGVKGSGNAMSVTLYWKDANDYQRYHVVCDELGIDEHVGNTNFQTKEVLSECTTYIFKVSSAPDPGCESPVLEIEATPFIPKTIAFEDGSTTTTLSTTCENDEIVVPTPTAQNCSTHVWIDEATGTKYTDGQTITPANDMTIVAKWSVETYTITFNDWDGTQLQQSTVECGQTPAYNGETPTRPENNTHKYTFAGWTPTIVPANSEATYTATYTETQHQITVIWMVNGEEYILGDPSTTVSAGEKVAKLPTPPSPDDYCGQVFAGWTDQPIDGAPIADAPAVLFNTPEASPTLYKEGDKTTVTFYAVFADIKE